MSYFFKILLLVILPILSFGESKVNIDSLKIVLQKKQKQKDVLGESQVLFEISNYYYNKQEDKTAFNFIEKGLKIVPEKQYFLKGQMLHKKAMLIYFIHQDLSQTLAIMHTAYPLLKQDTTDKILSFFLQSYGTFEIQNLNYQKGIDLLEEAERLNLKEKNKKNISHLLNIYANLLAAAQSMGNYAAALEYARKGIEIGKNSTDYELIGDLYYNNALVFLTLEKDDAAEESYFKALNSFEKANLPASIATVNIALGDYYNNHHHLKKGENYLKLAKNYFFKIEDKRSLAIVNKMIANNYFLKKEYKKAIIEINKSIDYFKNSGDKRGVEGLFFEKANYLFHDNQLDTAIFYAKQELANALKNENSFFQLESYLLLSKIEEKRKNIAAALAYYKKYTNTKDAIYTANVESKLAQERTKQHVEAAQETAQNATLKAKLLASEKQFFVSIAMGLAILLIVGGYLFFQLRKTQKQLKSQNLQLTQLNETKDKFFSIIAHDIRSPITALDSVGEQMNYYLLTKNETKLYRLADKVDKTAKRLTNLLDNLLNWALLQTGMIPYNPKSVNLKTVSNDIFELYEPVANTKKITLENNISEGRIVFADERALNTIIRNLVNNALKFTPENGVIRISETVKEDKIFIEINDTGTGISAEKLPKLFELERTSTDGTAGEKGSGLGLMLCKELVELNKGTIKAISELGKGSTFIFSIPNL